MKATANNAILRFVGSNPSGGFGSEIILTLTDDRQQVMREFDEVNQTIEKGKLLSVEIKPYRQKRSLNANAYLWVMLDKLAVALNTTKDELYIEMLDRYGVFTHLIVKPEAVERVKSEWRTSRELGEITINNKTGVQLQVYYGSSSYSVAEMARLIDGVVSECQDIGIETLPPDELESLKNLWGENNANRSNG